MNNVQQAKPTGITMTQTAVRHIKKYVAKQDDGKAMRLAVKKSGCSGLRYDVSIAHHINDDDVLFEHDGASVVIQQQDLFYYVGTEIDYIQEGLNWKLVFNNPNAQNACGCGESFNLKS